MVYLCYYLLVYYNCSMQFFEDFPEVFENYPNTFQRFLKMPNISEDFQRCIDYRPTIFNSFYHFSNVKTL